jgi:DNA primase
LIYKKEELSKQIIIVEGEIDYITLKALGFNSVI